MSFLKRLSDYAEYLEKKGIIWTREAILESLIVVFWAIVTIFLMAFGLYVVYSSRSWLY